MVGSMGAIPHYLAFVACGLFVYNVMSEVLAESSNLFQREMALIKGTATTACRRVMLTAMGSTTYISQPEGLPNRLYRIAGRNLRGHHGRRRPRVLDARRSRSSRTWRTTAIRIRPATRTGPLLFRNDGKARFTRERGGVHVRAAAAGIAHLRGDGRLRSRRLPRPLSLRLLATSSASAKTRRARRRRITTRRTARPNVLHAQRRTRPVRRRDARGGPRREQRSISASRPRGPTTTRRLAGPVRRQRLRPQESVSPRRDGERTGPLHRCRRSGRRRRLRRRA